MTLKLNPGNEHNVMASGCLQANDFGSEVIPGAKDMGMHIQAYLYDGYWEDIGTVEAFYEANLALTDSPQPKFRYASSVTVFFAACSAVPPSSTLRVGLQGQCV